MATDFSKYIKLELLVFQVIAFLPAFLMILDMRIGQKALEIFCDKNDLVILISSSGNSDNIVSAAKFCKKQK